VELKEEIPKPVEVRISGFSRDGVLKFEFNQPLMVPPFEDFAISSN
jgi:hypothetical protein